MEIGWGATQQVTRKIEILSGRLREQEPAAEVVLSAG